MSKVLVVIDMQNDFVTGALGSEMAQEIVPDLIEKIKDFDGQIIFTKDTHFENYMQTQEGKNLPVPHCIKGTAGHDLIPEINDIYKEEYLVFEKPTFPSKDLAVALEKINEKEKIQTITLVGVCTDICVISNAMVIKAFLPETPIEVIENLTAATSTQMKNETINVMKSCQIAVL